MKPIKHDIIYSGKSDAYKIINVWYKGSDISSVTIEAIETAIRYDVSYEDFKEKFRFKK